MSKETINLTKEEVEFIENIFVWGRKLNLLLFQATTFATGIFLLFTNNFKILWIAVPLALFFIIQYRSYLVKLTAFKDNLGKENKGKVPYQLSKLMEGFILQEFRFSFLHKKPIGNIDKEKFEKLEASLKQKLVYRKSEKLKEAVQ